MYKSRIKLLSHLLYEEIGSNEIKNKSSSSKESDYFETFSKLFNTHPWKTFFFFNIFLEFMLPIPNYLLKSRFYNFFAVWAFLRFSVIKLINLFQTENPLK